VKGVKGFVNNSRQIVSREQERNKIEINYQNLKAQCYYLLADRINEHKIAVRTSDESIKELLTEELEYVKSKDIDNDGKLKVIGKDDVKEAIGRSPDYSDALMMRIYFELQPQSMFSQEEIRRTQEIRYNRVMSNDTGL